MNIGFIDLCLFAVELWVGSGSNWCSKLICIIIITFLND